MDKEIKIDKGSKGVEMKGEDLELEDMEGQEGLTAMQLLSRFEELRGDLEDASKELGPDGAVGVLSRLGERFGTLARTLEELCRALRNRIETLEKVASGTQMAVKEEEELEKVIFVSAARRVYAIPFSSVRGVFVLPPKRFHEVQGLERITLRDREYPLIDLAQRLGAGKVRPFLPGEDMNILLLGSERGDMAVLVDGVLGFRELVVYEPEGLDEIFKGIVKVEKGTGLIDPVRLWA